jgi:hypothetical protein
LVDEFLARSGVVRIEITKKKEIEKNCFFFFWSQAFFVAALSGAAI